jgi:thioredoxin-like negative regulator of GroEL
MQETDLGRGDFIGRIGPPGLDKISDFSPCGDCANFYDRQLTMNTPSRRQKIEAMLAEEPSDRFLRYSLAMEYAKEGEIDKSLESLRSLMADDPPHVQAFFMAGQQLAKAVRIEEARAALREGIEQARQQGNSHAAGEMSEFLTSLGSLGE